MNNNESRAEYEITPEVRLDLYRRHTPACPHSQVKGGRTMLKCPGKRPCPLYCDGTVNGKRVRYSMGRDLERALSRVRHLEHARGQAAVEAVKKITGKQDKTLLQMITAYMREVRISRTTRRRYEQVLGAMASFVGEADLDHESFATLLSDFFRSKTTWNDNTVLCNMIVVCGFFNVAVRKGWVTRNWAATLPKPKIEGGRTKPFGDGEVAAMVQACDKLPRGRNGHGITREEASARARAFILAMAYTGLRISDVVQLRRDAIDSEGRILIKMQKTGRSVALRLKPALLDALKQITPCERLRDGFYFWNKEGDIHSACGMYRKILHGIEKYAGVEGMRPHRFRDTFALAVLDQGHELSTLQLLLGHSSIRTTERYYRHFSPRQQAIVDSAIASLNFGETPGMTPVDPLGNRGRNAQRNVVALPRPA